MKRCSCGNLHPVGAGCPVKERARNQQPTRAAHRTPTHRAVAAAVYSRDGHRCAACGATKDLTIDYIHPLARGGTMTVRNAQVLCRSCNSTKGAHTP